MDETKALAVIAALANGINPLTGETFPAGSPYQAPDIVRALFVAIRALEAKRGPRNTSAPAASAPGGPPANKANMGQRWSDEEDRRLLAQFDRGQAIAELAKLHGRSPTGIEARLAKHGRLPMPDLPLRGIPAAKDGEAKRASPDPRKVSFD